MDAANERKLREIFAAALRLPAIPAGDVSRESETNWDSLRHVELVFAIEDAFALRLTEAEMAALASLADAVRLIEAHGAA